ncbi:MAG TPA: hypothetical protein VK842_04090 [bacterium]|nr:hypothetical protein [bacterium]
MAEVGEATQTPEPSKGRGGELWVLAALAAAGLLCVCGLAVSLVLILGRGSAGAGNQVNPVINVGVAPTVPAAPSGPSRDVPAKPQAERDAAQDVRASALPGVLATPTPVKLQREKELVRAETQPPPSPPFPPADPSRPLPGGKLIYLRVRSVGDTSYKGQQALPMPIRYSPDATGKVDKVFASPAPAAAAAAGPADLAPPTQTFADTSADQAGWGLTLSNAHATPALDGYRAPDGFRFFTARVHAVNQGQSPAGLQADNFEIRDADGVRYLSNPELNAGFPADDLAAGAGADLTLSFLVPDSAELRALALLTGTAPVLLPLSKQ